MSFSNVEKSHVTCNIWKKDVKKVNIIPNILAKFN